MKRIIAFFVSIWVFLFGEKVVEPVKAEPKTLAEKMEEMKYEPKRRYQQRMVPQHNNRKNKPNKRGRRSRLVQYVPGGKAIYHEPTKKK
jgi:uncharacterized membrane protein